jgi:hypothetical protein
MPRERHESWQGPGLGGGQASLQFWSARLRFGGVAYWRVHSPGSTVATVPATPVTLTIDLNQAGTTRGGETSTVPPVDPSAASGRRAHPPSKFQSGR